MSANIPGDPAAGSGGDDTSPWARPREGEAGAAPTGADAGQGRPDQLGPTSTPGFGTTPPSAYAAPGHGSPLPQPGAVRPDIVAGGPSSGGRTLLWFGLAGGGMLVIGIVVLLVMAANGLFAGSGPGVGPFGEPSSQVKPPLAKACPPPSQSPSAAPPGEVLPPPSGPRLADPGAGISYAQLPAPWKPWDQGVWNQGTLGVEFERGYYIVTETYSGGEYLASVLSGKVPATVGDSLTLNLECAGRQVADDVRNSYYPRPNAKEQVRDQRTTLGGRPAWVSVFHLTFQAEGLTARGEMVAVVLIDVGRPDAAVLYVSIPETHKQFDPQIEKIIASVRPL